MAIGLAFQGLAALLLERYFMPRWNLAAFGVLGVVLMLVNRWLSRSLTRWRLGSPRVVLVGADDDVAMATRHIADIERDAVVVGRASRTSEVPAVVAGGRATDVLLLDVDAFESVYPEPMTSLESSGVGFLQRVTGRETMLGLQSVCQVAGMPFVRLRTHTVPIYKLRLKRAFDLVLLVVTAPVTLLLLALLAAFVRLRAGAPVLYRQVRVGRDGVPFIVVKFRTMVVDAERSGAVLAGRNDARVVPGLGWMRGTRADELPQLYHVLRGQMSWVGPRPERPEMTSDIERRVPGYIRRNELPPGLTGLAQVYGRYSTDAGYKLGYDLQYVVNWSLALDVQILLRTIWVVVSRRV
jgi:lipopolysaccharide/colanic/teichoic acid biosynthesis glycosyltransferase